MSSSVQEVAAKAQAVVLDSIPSKGTLSSRIRIASNVIDIPKTCGILTSREIEITEKQPQSFCNS